MKIREFSLIKIEDFISNTYLIDFKCVDLSENDSTIYRQQIKKFEVEFSYTVEQIKYLIIYELETAKKPFGQADAQQTPPQMNIMNKLSATDFKLDSNDIKKPAQQV